ncbi:hypothetical protein LCGC14_3115140 [marine sediment metagenome]|uniref:Methyltransferase type 11 domain-containing protein n=1 Tax=marine sediment metagenome TaxID=412755 RepID=A0A0F8WSZ1_9ZZZZ
MKNDELGNGRQRYFSKRYLTEKRWATYSELIKRVLELNPVRILEIGMGNHLVADILEKMGYYIKVLDYDKSLNPDYVLDVRDKKILDFKDQFDLIISSQTFEHIKYSEYLEVISNLSLITKNLIITLPYCNRHSYILSFSINFPYFKADYVNVNYINVRAGKKFYYKKSPPDYNRKHCWEIGTKGFPPRKIKKDIKKKGWIIKKSFFNQNNPYHYFFILISKNHFKK